MGANIVALAYVWIAHAMAFVLIPQFISMTLRIRTIAFWGFAAGTHFVLQDFTATLLLAAVGLALLAPTAPADRASYFIIVAPALPTFITAPIPFPGLNLLLEMTHYLVAVVILVLPIPMLLGRRKRSNENWLSTIADISLLLYLLYTAVVVLIALDAISALRLIGMQFLLVAAPYYFLRMAISTMDDLDYFLRAFLVVGVVLGAVAFVSAGKQWDFYTLLSTYGHFIAAEYRSGFLRLNATVTNNGLAIHLMMGLLALEIFSRQAKFGWIVLNGLRVFLAFGILMCDSRGAIAATLIAYSVFFVSMLESKALRWLAIWLCVAMGAAFGAWLAIADFSTLPNNSFTYRQELLTTSLDYLRKYPVFGDFNFATSGYFDNLVQGQGIIDIVSFYLQIALQYGAVGLVLFFGAIILPGLNLIIRLLAFEPRRAVRASSRPSLRSADRNGETRDNEAGDPGDVELARWRVVSAGLLGLLIAWLFLVATTSDVGLMQHAGLVIATVCSALGRLEPRRALAKAVSRPKPARSLQLQ